MRWTLFLFLVARVGFAQEAPILFRPQGQLHVYKIDETIHLTNLSKETKASSLLLSEGFVVLILDDPKSPVVYTITESSVWDNGAVDFEFEYIRDDEKVEKGTMTAKVVDRIMQFTFKINNAPVIVLRSKGWQVFPK